MNTADIFLLTNDVTNRCNPLYEAAWAGLPVVSVQDPSTADLLKHNNNALLSQKDDHEELGKNIAELCRNDALCAKIKVAQKQLSETFWSWDERMKGEVIELERLLSESSISGQGGQDVE